jgi:uncharacterized protein DUF1553/uncharacterized protein DUF1549/cytochrome c
LRGRFALVALALFGTISMRLGSQSPVLQQNCVACHNDQTRTSGLSVLSRESLLTGGNRGPAVVPGKASESLLIRALRHEGDLKMPPTGKLPAEAVAAVAEWVDRGAPWMAGSQPTRTGVAKSSTHWAFQPVKRSPVPTVRDASRVRNPIDGFVLARLEREGLSPSPEADRYTLIRRLSIDLIGLTPSADEVQQFVSDPRPDAYERLVDRLLASPHYGERWGRHWLDVARYADSNGYVRDGARQIWMYRDWVIQALNRDLPFDQFVIEQLAGDLLPKASREQIVATGFHRNTPINLEGGVDFEEYRVEAVADRVSTTGRVFLGLTVGCARCHDHKYDPVSQREFYQLYAFFNSIDELSGEFSDLEGRARAFDPLLEFGTPDQYAEREAASKQVAKLREELAEYEKALSEKYRDWEKAIPAEERAKITQRALTALQTPPEKRADSQRNVLRRLFSRLDAGYRQRESGLRAVEQAGPKIPHTLVMRDLPQPRASYLHLGGDFTRRGIQVHPDTPAVLPPLAKQGSTANRLDLARWLADPQHPLTARVTVNRVWQRYFGLGLVATEDDFGVKGDPPSHPELLDWLASEFVSRGWSLKQLHRLIVTSATYRQSSRQRENLSKADPQNRLLARQTRLRLEAEIVRDVALSASGMLNPKIGGPSVFPPQPEVAGPTPDSGAWVADKGENRYRRGLYTSFRRGAPHPVMLAFDAPDAGQSCTRRNRSNTPLQALALLNDEAFYEFAQGLARRVLREAPASNPERLRYAFWLCLARAPRPDEETRLQQFLARQLDHFQTDPSEARALAGAADANVAAWIGTSRILLNLDEFITRE